MRRLLIAVWLGVLLVLPCEAARASCFEPSFADLVIHLRKDMLSVPTNAVLTSPSRGTRGVSLVARAPDGGEIPFDMVVDGARARFTPRVPLAPSMLYALDCRGPSAAFPDLGCPQLTTSSGDDDEGPREAPAGDVDIQDPAPLGGHVECPLPPNSTAISFSAFVPDDAAALILRRTHRGETVVVAVATGNVPARMLDASADGGDVQYTLSAVDDAGNEGPATEVTTSFGCPGSCGQADGMPAFLVLAAAHRRHRRRRQPVR